MAKSRKNPDFRPTRILSPTTAPVQQFYDPSALAQVSDFQKSYEVASAFSELSRSLTGFAKTYTEAEKEAGRQEFLEYAKSPQKLKEKATEYIESAGRLAPWRVRSFLKMYGGQTMGSEYRSQAFAKIDSLSEFTNPDGTLKTDDQVRQELSELSKSLGVPNSFYVQQGFNEAVAGVNNELIVRVGQERVKKARQATEDQATAEALDAVQNTVDPKSIEEKLGTILKGTYKSGLQLTSQGRQAVVFGVARYINRELDSNRPDYDRIQEVMTIFDDGVVGGVKMTPDILGLVEELQNKIDKSSRLESFRRDVEDAETVSNGLVTEAALDWVSRYGGNTIPTVEQAREIVDPLLANLDLSSDVMPTVRSQLVGSFIDTVERRAGGERSFDQRVVDRVARSVASGEISTLEELDRYKEEIPADLFLQLRTEIQERMYPNFSGIRREVLAPFTDLRLFTDAPDVLDPSMRASVTARAFRSLNARIDEYTRTFNQDLENARLAASDPGSRDIKYRQGLNEYLNDPTFLESLRKETNDHLAGVDRRTAVAVANRSAAPFIAEQAEVAYPTTSLAGGIEEIDSATLLGRQRYQDLFYEMMADRIGSRFDSGNPFTVSEFTDPVFLQNIDAAVQGQIRRQDEMQGDRQVQEQVAEQLSELVRAKSPVPQFASSGEFGYLEYSAMAGLPLAYRAYLESPNTPERRANLTQAGAEVVSQASTNVDRLSTDGLSADSIVITGTSLLRRGDSHRTDAVGVRVRIERGTAGMMIAPDGIYRMKASDALRGISKDFQYQSFFGDGALGTIEIPMPLREFRALPEESQRNMVAEALNAAVAQNAVVNPELTGEYVFNLGIVGFDIEDATNGNIGGLQVTHGRPYVNMDSPYDIDLSQGPPNPAVFLYGNEADLREMIREFDSGSYGPESKLGRIMDIFDNTISPETFLILQRNRRQALGQLLDEDRQ